MAIFYIQGVTPLSIKYKIRKYLRVLYILYLLSDNTLYIENSNGNLVIIELGKKCL